MALADERGAQPASNGDHGFERQPPQDLAAEQSVLGGMMLSKDAIADVVEVLTPNDFYRPAHQAIYDCVLDLYGRGEPADAITVSAELERRQELKRIGGAPYMHTLIASVPTAANAGYYAEIVAEKAVLRRLVEAGTRIVQLGYHGAEGSAIEEVVDRAQSAIYDVTEKNTSEDYAALEDLLQPTMDEIDAIASRGGESQGIPTGFTDLDEVTNGLHPGQMIIVAARPGVGKALALDTPLPTPDGWTTMGEVATGDELIGVAGRPVRVLRATEVLTDRPCYEIEFSDGGVIVADAEHQWRLADGDVLTTARLAAEQARPQLPAHGGFRLPQQELPVAPYALGVWLAAGDGSGEVHGDRELLELAGLAHATESDGAAVTTVGAVVEYPDEPAEPERSEAEESAKPAFGVDIPAALSRFGAWDDHDLPLAYLRASEEQRRALLAGLLDAAGSVSADGTLRLEISEPLSVRVRELVLSLGYTCGARIAESEQGDFDRVALVFDSGADEVFRLPAKNTEHKKARQEQAQPLRSVVDIREVPGVPVRCVEVDAPDHLYLAGRGMVPTHNSTLGLDFARTVSIKHGMASVIFSLEMGKTEIVMRMLSAEARIRLGDMRGGRMTDDDWTRLARRMSEISEAPLYVDDSPNLTMMEIRAKARRLKQRADIQLVVLDYMQLMTSGKRVESRQQEVSEFSRNLKLLAKELEVPVVAISQLNRGPEQRNDKRPQLSDLRESGSLEQDADMVILIHRPDAFERDDPRMGEADLILAKHRAGPTSTITVAHQLHYSRFVDMAPE
ncbi:replicative DNA helicase [Saccharopolyspora gloriosae]|uniref:replicative DNA helicase n=1 Tax=Saccharopolyspora gloriosae TaxID=455344 RepID=UPI001FB574A6|nr:replicative DNA helicase [Saccharopolyspora gloriosae]